MLGNSASFPVSTAPQSNALVYASTQYLLQTTILGVPISFRLPSIFLFAVFAGGVSGCRSATGSSCFRICSGADLRSETETATSRSPSPSQIQSWSHRGGDCSDTYSSCGRAQRHLYISADRTLTPDTVFQDRCRCMSPGAADSTVVASGLDPGAGDSKAAGPDLECV